jgi:hypothetical protein
VRRRVVGVDDVTLPLCMFHPSGRLSHPLSLIRLLRLRVTCSSVSAFLIAGKCDCGSWLHVESLIPAISSISSSPAVADAVLNILSIKQHTLRGAVD